MTDDRDPFRGLLVSLLIGAFVWGGLIAWVIP